MNLISVIVYVVLGVFWNSVIAETTVPSVGSEWRSTLTYLQLSNNSSDHGNGSTGSVARRMQEVSKVVRLENGVPVFKGEVFGYSGEIVETSRGTIVYTDECRDKVPQEVWTVPPKEPNQCVWHLCTAPDVGETVSRPMIFFVGLYACKPQVATYTFSTMRKEVYNGIDVKVGNAKLYFDAFRQTSWISFLQDRHGEIFAKSPARETVYDLVKVTQTPFLPKTIVMLNPEVTTITSQDEKFEKCDIVAFGDSLTEGMGASRKESYPAKLAEMLLVPVCNLGVSGNTTEIAKARLPQVLDRSPKVVLVTLGANDAFQGVNPADTLANLSYIIKLFREKDIFVVLLGFDGVVASAPGYVKELLKVHHAFSEHEGVLLLPDAFKGVLDNREMLSSDGIHPNAVGYKKLAENVMDQVFGILKAIGISAK